MTKNELAAVLSHVKTELGACGRLTYPHISEILEEVKCEIAKSGILDEPKEIHVTKGQEVILHIEGDLARIITVDDDFHRHETTINIGKPLPRKMRVVNLLHDMTDSETRDMADKLFAKSPRRFKVLIGALHGVMYKKLGLF